MNKFVIEYNVRSADGTRFPAYAMTAADYGQDDFNDFTKGNAPEEPSIRKRLAGIHSTDPYAEIDVTYDQAMVITKKSAKYWIKKLEGKS